MKTLVIIIFVFSSIIIAQKNNESAADKGNISLTLNDEKIELPVSHIILTKANDIILTARAEKNTEENLKLISFEITFESKAFSDNKEPKAISFSVTTRNKYQTQGKELFIHYSPKNKKREIHYKIFKNGESISWELSSFHMVFGIENITYSGGTLKITGTFSAEFRSSLKQNNENNLVEIKDGKFEIIF